MMNNKKRIPPLRFPEFRDAGEWEEKRLGNEGEFFSSLTGKAGADFDAGEARFITYMNVFSNTFVDPKALRFVDVKEGENQNAVVMGDVFFTISSETPDEVGMSSVLLDELENCYLNSFCALFRFYENKRPNLVFTGYLLRQSLVRTYFAKKAQGSTRFNLSKDSFRSLPFIVPTQLSEQQKIADCLSSIDELIGVQSQKVEALKAHKKGLMQKLFPREGETTPRLRFPAFRDTGEWEEISLGSIGKVSMCKRILKEETKPNGDIPFYKIGTFGKQADAYISREIYENYKSNYPHPKKGDILISAAGTIGRLVVFDGEDAYFQDSNIVWIDNNESLIKNVFLFYCYARIKWVTDDNTIPRLYNDNLKGMKIAITSIPEQQKIADCLSSIDELISAHSQKLETLKTHKNGLMQALFPVTDVMQS